MSLLIASEEGNNEIMLQNELNIRVLYLHTSVRSYMIGE